MALLITRDDIAQYRQVSETVYDNVLNQHITDAQFVDLQRLMGSDFYNDLIRNNTDAKYTALLDGGDYTYQGVTYTNVGLKAVIAHYAYARYIKYGSMTDTPFSLVEKLSPDSQPADINMKRSLYKDNQNTAFNYWENVQQFLDRNASTYPLWRDGCAVNNKSRFNIYKVENKPKTYKPIRTRFKYSN